MEARKLLDDCRSGWLMVEKDFSARLFKQEQLKYALQCMGRNPSDKAVSRYWTQCGGSMSYEQFSLVMKRERKTTMRDLMSSFRRIDLNGDGYITAQELHRVLTKRGEKMSHDEVQAIIDEADQNGDGKLDYAEFAHMLLNTSEECVQAAKQRASVVSKTNTTGGDTKKKKSSKKGSTRRSSFDQRLREAGQSRIYIQGQLNNSYFKEENVFDPVVQPVPSLTTQIARTNSVESSIRSEVHVPHTAQVERQPYTNESTAQNIELVGEAPIESIPPQKPLSTRARNSLEDFLTVDSTPVTESPINEPPKNSLPDALEPRASSLTKLPPLKKTPLPPLIAPIEAASKPPLSSLPSEDRKDDKVGYSRESKEDKMGECSSAALEQSVPNQAPESNTQADTSEPLKSNKRPGQPSDETSDSKHLSQEQPTTNQTTATSQPTAISQTIAEAGEGVVKAQGDGEGKERQTDHLQNGRGEEAKSVAAPPASVVSLPPKKPKNIQSWNSITGKGCFYLDLDDDSPSNTQGDEEGTIHCHHYQLRLPSPTNVWIEVGVATAGNLATDTLLFVFHTNKSEEPTELIAYTQHQVGEHWVCRLDLDAGVYALVPFTSRCQLKPREDEGKGGVALISEEGGRVSLSPGCREALEEVFHRMDLDGNGFISRTEFDFFQERTSGEICDDFSWKVIQDNFELTSDDELTLRGFLELHLMTAEDEEGGEEELREILEAMGYSSSLQLDQACPFLFNVYTEDNEGEIEIVDLLPSTPYTDPALCALVKERGVCEGVRDGREELYTHTFTTPHMTTIAVENKSAKNASVQLDCSGSTNCVFSRDSPLHVVYVPANSTVIGFHIQPLVPSEPHSINYIASKILS